MRVLLPLLAAACATQAEPSPQGQAVIEQVNALRALHGLAPLRADPALAAAARAHAGEQARLGRISHLRADGATLAARLERVGYAHRAAGENVASGWERPSEVAQGWWDSVGHRENLLRPRVTEVGVGTARGPRGRRYWTLIVAQPDREV